jgi:hypothetical protein
MRRLPLFILGLSLLGLQLPMQAAPLDFLFGKKADAEKSAPEPGRRSWPIGQFTSVDLVPREPGGPDNQHPAAWAPELLRAQLGSVRVDTSEGPEPLFAADELDALVVPLSRALASAKPADDVLLLSTHRRGGAFFMAPKGITARIFVADGNLQIIVHDARLDFYNNYIGSKVEPSFTFGSRAKAGGDVLQSAMATSRRKDWLSIAPVAAGAASAAAAPAAAAPAVAIPAAAPQPVATAPRPPESPVAAPPPAPAGAAKPPAAAPAGGGVPVPRPRDSGFAEEIEQRLLTLKRLLDRGLISETEYQQKRKEVLQLL